MALLRSASRWSAARQRPNGYTRAGLVNLARDRWRARRCRHATASPATRPSHCRLPGDVTAAVPGQQLLPRARQPPPVQQRAVLVLRLWQDHSVNETAAAVRPWRPIRQAVRPPRPHVTFRDASSSWPWAPDPICAGMASWPLAAMRRTRRSAAAAVAHGAPAWSRSMVLSPCAFPAGIAGVAAGEERGDLLAAASRPVPWGSASRWRVARAQHRDDGRHRRGDVGAGVNGPAGDAAAAAAADHPGYRRQLCCAAGGAVGRGRPAAGRGR